MNSRTIMAVKAVVFLLSLFLNFFSICTSEEVTVSCALKTNCVLPCGFQAGPYTAIHWVKTPGDIQVHSYSHGQDQLSHQHEDYRGRTSLFVEEISREKASLQLTEVKVQDEGSYMCFTSTTSDSRVSSVVLKVFVDIGEVILVKVGSDLICSSEGIYPKPEVTWSPPPSSTETENRTMVHQRKDQLYNISSSVRFQDVPLTYTCSIRTNHSRKYAHFVWQEPKTVLDTDAVIHCPFSNVYVTWRFNYKETILNWTGSEVVYNESWGWFVDGVTQSNSLVLKNLTKDHQGSYSCHCIGYTVTYIASTQLKIVLNNRYVMLLIECEPNQLCVNFVYLVLIILCIKWKFHTKVLRWIRAGNEQSSTVSGRAESVPVSSSLRESSAQKSVSVGGLKTGTSIAETRPDLSRSQTNRGNVANESEEPPRPERESSTDQELETMGKEKTQ